MSNTLYRQAVEKMLMDGLFSGYDTLADELGVREDELRLALDEAEGQEIPLLAKLKILAFSGVTDLRSALHIVESETMTELRAPPFLDTGNGSIRWLEALESLKRSAGFIEDKELAAYLGIPPSTLSDFRRGKAEISSRIKLRILDHLGFHRIVTGIEFLLKDEAAAALKRARQRQARKIADQKRVNDEA